MFRKTVEKMIVGLMVLVMASGAFGQDMMVDVYIHGEHQKFDPGARVQSGVTYAPLRAVAEALGAEVTYFAHRENVVVCSGDSCTDVPLEQTIKVDNRLLAPLRVLAEALDATVEWHAEAREVSIRTGLIGLKALPMELDGVDGPYRRTAFDDKKAVVLVFWANHCPTVIAYEPRFIPLVEEYKPRGVEFVAIASNCPEKYPADNFENMKIRARDKGYNFHYVHDITQKFARYYQAERTPDVYVVNPSGYVVYRGRIESAQDPAQVTRHDLREALDELLAGKPISVSDTPPHGCTIKWK